MSTWRNLWRSWSRRRCRLPTQILALANPLPGGSTRLTDLRILALDFETTGLDPRRDRILSAGWVRIDAGRIVFASARELTVRAHGIDSVGQSAVIHGILDSDLGTGVDEARLLATLLPELDGAVIAAHAAGIEHGFLNALLKRHGGLRMPHAFIDTLALEQRLTQALGQSVDGQTGALTLPESRRRHGLHEHAEHSAGADAMACAELLLAQVALLGGVERCRLYHLR